MFHICVPSLPNYAYTATFLWTYYDYVFKFVYECKNKQPK